MAVNAPTDLHLDILGRVSGSYRHGFIYQPDCDVEDCPLRNDVRVQPDGPVPAQIAFVGEEPGDTECREGRGFVGPSGQLLWQLAADIGLKREDVWVTNASCCRARKVKLTTGAMMQLPEVKARAAKACRRRLLRELIAVDPVVIVPLGNWALWSLSDIPHARIYAYRGSRVAADLRDLLDRVEKGLTRSPMREVKEP